uniref:TNFR-Cys domain-containing protein n=1 Tax=Tetradesmus obliquus TaxID=3088 RepID=A0A383W7M8_TETOB|eukprot:jgi/Sobl393_1/17951/SZX72994.1
MNVTSWVFLLVVSASLLVVEGVKFDSVCPIAGTSNCVSCTGTRACLDLSSDSNSCGACFKACQSGQVCQEGACVVPACKPLGSSCGDAANVCCPAPGVACCGGNTCVNTTSNKFNCGGCGRQCLSTQTCVNSACVTSSSGGSQLINLQYGAFSTCDTVTGDGISQTARCSDPANVPAYPLTIPPSTFSNFGVGVYNPAAPRCLWLSTCTTQIAFNNASVQIDLLWDPAVAISGTTFTTCVSRNCPDGSAGSQIIIANSGSANGETVYIASASGLCISGVSAMARMSMDCAYNTPMPIP